MPVARNHIAEPRGAASDNRVEGYNVIVITRGIREFIRRDWRAVRASKDDYWRDRIARLGPAEGLRAGDELRRQVLLQNPGWPSAADRHADLQSHIRLSRLLRSADPARGR